MTRTESRRGKYTWRLSDCDIKTVPFEAGTARLSGDGHRLAMHVEYGVKHFVCGDANKASREYGIISASGRQLRRSASLRWTHSHPPVWDERGAADARHRPIAWYEDKAAFRAAAYAMADKS